MQTPFNQELREHDVSEDYSLHRMDHLESAVSHKDVKPDETTYASGIDTHQAALGAGYGGLVTVIHRRSCLVRLRTQGRW